MGNCNCGGEHGSGGPFAEGRELVEFVARAHGGSVANRPLPSQLETDCQGCGAAFTLTTFVGQCQFCGGVHAVSPPRCDDAANIQFAGKDYRLPG